MTYPPSPPCPTCGLRGYARTFALRHGRAVIVAYPFWWSGRKHRGVQPLARPIRVPRKLYKVEHLHWRSGRRSRTYAVCADPYHDYHPPKPPIPRGRIGDNSDIRKAKASLSRALQGKARR